MQLSRDDVEWLIAEARYAQQIHSRHYSDMDRIKRIAAEAALTGRPRLPAPDYADLAAIGGDRLATDDEPQPHHPSESIVKACEELALALAKRRTAFFGSNKPTPAETHAARHLIQDLLDDGWIAPRLGRSRNV